VRPRSTLPPSGSTFPLSALPSPLRLVHIRNGVATDVARYDTAHGRPHRDLVTPSGRLLRKDWLEDMSFNDALTQAIDDFKKNHEAYTQDRP